MDKNKKTKCQTCLNPPCYIHGKDKQVAPPAFMGADPYFSGAMDRNVDSHSSKSGGLPYRPAQGKHADVKGIPLDAKVEPHHCNVVPSEMHERMVQERNKTIYDLQRTIERLKDDLFTKAQKDPQPAREGWWKPILAISIYGLIAFCTGMIIWIYLRTPAAPKGTGDAWREKCQVIWLELGCKSGAQSGPCKVLDE